MASERAACLLCLKVDLGFVAGVRMYPFERSMRRLPCTHRVRSSVVRAGSCLNPGSRQEVDDYCRKEVALMSKVAGTEASPADTVAAPAVAVAAVGVAERTVEPERLLYSAEASSLELAA